MSDATESPVPGWYQIAGDLRKYWDGTRWIDGSAAPPPSATAKTDAPARLAPVPGIIALSVVGAIGIVLGVILGFVTFAIGGGTDPNTGLSADLTAADLAGRVAVATFAGVCFGVGVISSIVAASLIAIRDILRRYKNNIPF